MPRRYQPNPQEEPQYGWAPATPDDREAQMIHLADQLAQRQLIDGTASAQVITHYLKLGSSRERLEQEKIRLEQAKLQAQVDQIEAMARQEELFAEAIRAMRSYQGVPEDQQ